MSIERGLSFGIIAIVLFIIATLIKCSNEEKPEVRSEGIVHYTLNWEKAFPDSKAPDHLYYCFYPSESGVSIQTEGNAEELMFVLPPDKYKMLIFNCDGDHVKFRNLDKFETAEIYIPSSKASSNGISSINPIYGVAVNDLIIENGENNPVEVTPVPLVRNVTFKVNVKGIKNVVSCTGTLSKVSYALNLSKQQVVQESIADATFETTPSEEGVNGNIMILGKPIDKDDDENPVATPHEVTFNFTMNDGSIASSTVDLGTTLDETNGGNIEVKVEATIQKNMAFSVKITHWEVASGDSLIIE